MAPSLLIVLAIVLALSIYGGYSLAIAPWNTIILHDSGMSFEQIAANLMFQSTVSVVLAYGAITIDLVASYYLGKRYVLTKLSGLVLVSILIVTAWIGKLIGYLIVQTQYPQYPVLNANIIFALIDSASFVAWSMLGILAGNYKREIETRTKT